MRNDRDKGWKSLNDEADRRIDDHERRPARLVPHAILESIRESGVAHDGRSLWQVTNDGASVRIIVIVAVARIVMLVIGLHLRRFGAHLPVGECGVEAGCEEGGVQEARGSHGNSPWSEGKDGTTPGRQQLMISAMVTR
ncbi:MAG TPA: hypothetical protein VN676_09560 [Steroidobacteraceae bacterium]|nr:hypothetical protein [Steroidobacteraceae bacterium]